MLAFFDTTTVQNIDERKRRITIRHLLTMIDAPMAAEPGQRWNYNSGASQLLADIFRTATGTDIEAYAARHLFAPIGIKRWYWKRTPSGVVDTEGGLYLAAEDLARIWYLFLRDGLWSGSGFGGQFPMALPREDLIVVFNAWNIIPGRPNLPRARTLARIVAGVK